MLAEDKIRAEIVNLRHLSPNDINSKLEEIANSIDLSTSISPKIRSELFSVILAFGATHPNTSKPYLYELAKRSMEIFPNSGSCFSLGLLAGILGKPFDSIAAYLKAIDLGDPNPSLCYLNAGHRFREMNDLNIAFAFYEKSVEVNPSQFDAWFAGAKLAEQIGNSTVAKEYYLGFLNLYDKLPDTIKNHPKRSLQASEAQNYVNNY